MCSPQLSPTGLAVVHISGVSCCNSGELLINLDMVDSKTILQNLVLHLRLPFFVNVAEVQVLMIHIRDLVIGHPLDCFGLLLLVVH